MDKEITGDENHDRVISTDLEKRPDGDSPETSNFEEESSEDVDGGRDIHGIKVRQSKLDSELK